MTQPAPSTPESWSTGDAAQGQRHAVVAVRLLAWSGVSTGLAALMFTWSVLGTSARHGYVTLFAGFFALLLGIAAVGLAIASLLMGSGRGVPRKTQIVVPSVAIVVIVVNFVIPVVAFWLVVTA